MRRYWGSRTTTGTRVIVEVDEGLLTPYRRELPAGTIEFDWGPAGGPARRLLAWELLVDAAGDPERFFPFLVRFEAEVLSLLGDCWTIGETDILRWLMHQERQAAIDEVAQRLIVGAGIREPEESKEDGAAEAE